VSRSQDVERIRVGLAAAADAVRPYTPGAVDFVLKRERHDPVTEADRAANRVLRDILPQAGEGWLSEESVDDASRLAAERLWVVDPIDGTREFVEGLPEWCISIALVENGLPVAGGIFNPATGETVLGSVEGGVTYNNGPARVLDRGLDGAVVLASRSESRRGEWEHLASAPFEIRPCGSVAYKMALVAAGRVDATWTLVPKSEWDVAAGTALVRGAGGRVVLADGSEPPFNQERPVFPNFVAAGPKTLEAVLERWLEG
jgi:myo-inositol-1(or 4)-monophosphatase